MYKFILISPISLHLHFLLRSSNRLFFPWITVMVLSCSDISDSVTLCTVALQASLSMEFSRQEYWSGLPFPSPGDIPNSGIELGSPASQADSLPTEPPGKPCNDI